MSRLIRPDPEGNWAHDLLPAWQELVRDADEPNFIFAPDALLPALRYLADGSDVRIFLLWTGEPGLSDLAGLVPLAPSSRFNRWRIPNISIWMHAHAYLGTPLIRPGYQDRFWKALRATVAEEWWGGVLRVARIVPDGPAAQALTAQLAGEAAPFHVARSIKRAFLDVPTDPAAYLEGHIRGKKRKEFRRQRRRLEELGSLDVATSDGEDIERWITDFLGLEAKGWKGEENSALASDPAGRAFFTEMVSDAARNGHFVGVAYRLGGVPIAMLINFRCGEGCFAFKTSYDEEYARFSPGVLIELDAIEVMAERNIVWVDSCAAPDHPMIDSLWAGRRTIEDIAVPLPGPARRLCFEALKTGNTLYRRYLK